MARRVFKGSIGLTHVHHVLLFSQEESLEEETKALDMNIENRPVHLFLLVRRESVS